MTARNLRLAEALGAEAHTLIGTNVAETVLEYARSRNVTKIIVGKTAQPRWKQWFRQTVVGELLEHCGNIDVYVITGEGAETALQKPHRPRRPVQYNHYLVTAAIVATLRLAGLGQPHAAFGGS